jgi:hypothetical protein
MSSREIVFSGIPELCPVDVIEFQSEAVMISKDKSNRIVNRKDLANLSAMAASGISPVAAFV